jgi:hypothetical protein
MKKLFVLFWIKSNRGTNSKTIFEIPLKWKKDEIEDALKQWCSSFGAWTHSDNVVRYGYKTIKIPPRRELSKAWHNLCDKKHKMEERWSTMREMFNPKHYLMPQKSAKKKL